MCFILVLSEITVITSRVFECWRCIQDVKSCGLPLYADFVRRVKTPLDFNYSFLSLNIYIFLLSAVVVALPPHMLKSLFSRVHEAWRLLLYIVIFTQALSLTQFAQTP